MGLKFAPPDRRLRVTLTIPEDVDRHIQSAIDAHNREHPNAAITLNIALSRLLTYVIRDAVTTGRQIVT